MTATDETNPARDRIANFSAEPINFGGLQNGDTYTFTVAATNKAGTGPTSAPSKAVVPTNPVSFASLSPSALGQWAKNLKVTLTGTGFTDGATLSVTGSGVTLSDVTVVNATTITASAAVTRKAATGTRSITITDGAGSASCTRCLTVDARPQVYGIMPSHMAVGGKGKVTFEGSGFQVGATIQFVPNPLTAFTPIKVTNVTVAATSITATLYVPHGEPIGDYIVRVTNPDGGRAIDIGYFTVIPAPTVSAISPTSAAAGTTVPVTITGSRFAAGASVKGPRGVAFSQVDVVNATTIDATMTVARSATVGTGEPITVTNNVTGGYGKATGDILTVT